MANGSNVPASSPAHSRITLSFPDFEVVGTWARKSGGNVSSEPRKWHEGGELFKEEQAGGPTTTENVTVSRNYRYDRDAPILRWAKKNAGRAMGTFSEQDLDANGEPVGDPFVSECMLQGVNGREVNADDTTGFQNLELTLSVSGESS